MKMYMKGLIMIIGILDSIKKINLVDFFVSNLLWEAFVLLIFGFIFKRTYIIYQTHKKANRIATKLLSNNRPSLNGKTPLYLADRFIQIWDLKDTPPYLYDNKQTYLPRVASKAFFHEVAIHKILKDLGLILINDDNRKTISPIKDELNTLVYVKCTNYLIKFQFDSVEEYKKK